MLKSRVALLSKMPKYIKPKSISYERANTYGEKL